MNELKFNTIGKVIKGEYPNWYIQIKDQRQYDNSKMKTGGIFIIQSDSISFDGVVYDDWVSDRNVLDIFFSEEEWEIEWLE